MTSVNFLASAAAAAFSLAVLTASPGHAQTITETSSKVSVTGEEVRPPAGMLPDPNEPQVLVGPAQQTSAKVAVRGRISPRN